MIYPFFNYIFASPLFVPTDNRPPTIYDILNAMANFDKPENEQIKVSHLAEQMHSRVFNFSYPLSTNIDKNKFEIMILNKFLMRRIGFETFTAFKIHGRGRKGRLHYQSGCEPFYGSAEA